MRAVPKNRFLSLLPLLSGAAFFSPGFLVRSFSRRLVFLVLFFLIGGIGTIGSLQGVEVSGEPGSREHLFGRALTVATQISVIQDLHSFMLFELEVRSFFGEWDKAPSLSIKEMEPSLEEETLFLNHPLPDRDQFLPLIASEKKEALQVLSLGNPLLTQLVMTKIRAKLLYGFLGALFSLGRTYQQPALDVFLVEVREDALAADDSIEKGFGLLEHLQQQDIEYLAFDQDISIAFLNAACMKLGAIADFGKPGTWRMLWHAAIHFEGEGRLLQSGLEALSEGIPEKIPLIIDHAQQEQSQAWREVNYIVNTYAQNPKLYQQLDVPNIISHLPTLEEVE
jgi:hypothetical protein